MIFDFFTFMPAQPLNPKELPQVPRATKKEVVSELSETPEETVKNLLKAFEEMKDIYSPEQIEILQKVSKKPIKEWSPIDVVNILPFINIADEMASIRNLAEKIKKNDTGESEVLKKYQENAYKFQKLLTKSIMILKALERVDFPSKEVFKGKAAKHQEYLAILQNFLDKSKRF